MADVVELMPPSQPGYTGILEQLLKLVHALSLAQDGLSDLWFQMVVKGCAAKKPVRHFQKRHVPVWHKKAVLPGLVDLQHAKTADTAVTGVKTMCLPDPGGNAGIMDACDGLGVQTDYDAYVRFAKKQMPGKRPPQCLGIRLLWNAGYWAACLQPACKKTSNTGSWKMSNKYKYVIL